MKDHILNCHLSTPELWYSSWVSPLFPHPRAAFVSFGTCAPPSLIKQSAFPGKFHKRASHAPSDSDCLRLSFYVCDLSNSILSNFWDDSIWLFSLDFSVLTPDKEVEVGARGRIN